MKKSFILFFISILSGNILTTCKQPSKDALIIGEWRVDSVKKYDNGEDMMIRISQEENLFLGSLSNPSMVKFTDKNESFFFNKNDTEKNFSSYKISNDTLNCKSNGTYRILTLNDR